MNLKFKTEGKIPPIKFLVGSRHAGLLYFNGSSMKRYYPKYRVYGITKRKDKWYACVKDPLNKYGCVLQFSINNNLLSSFKDVINKVPRDIHQMDFIGQDLMLMSAEHGSVIKYINFPQKNKFDIYKIGDAMDHYNSIYCYGGKIFLLAHRQYVKTGKNSIIVHADMCFRKHGSIAVDGKCCHNVYKDKKNIIVCDSLGGRVLVNNKPKLKNMGFVRGLSISDDYILIGSSKRATNNLDREGLGSINIFNRKFKRIGRIFVPKTQIYEIRRVDKVDYCLSNNSKKNKNPIMAII